MAPERISAIEFAGIIGTIAALRRRRRREAAKIHAAACFESFAELRRSPAAKLVVLIMACFVLVLFVIVGIVVVTAIGQAQAKQFDSDWADAAKALRLRFVPTTLLQTRRIDGVIRGQRVCVEVANRGTDNGTAHTHYLVRYAHPLGFELRLTRQGMMAPILSLFSGAKLDTGDADFDKYVLIKGRDRQRIREFLTPTRREQIRRLFLSSEECLIDDEKVERFEPGVQRSSEQLAAVVRRLVSFALLLSEEHQDAPLPEVEEVQPEEAQPAVAVLAAPRNDEAVPVMAVPQRIQSVPVMLEIAEPPHEPRIAEEASPGLAADASPAPVLPEPQREFAEPAPAPQVVPEITVAAVCADLFDPQQMMFQAATRFAERYGNKPIRWTGVLRRVSTYAPDLVFGNQPGTKAVFEIFEVAGGLLGSNVVHAVLQLPPEIELALQRRIGERVTFAGRLTSCDNFTRNVFVVDGRVE